MSYFAVVAPPLYSHFSALEALSQSLLKRGHRITFFHQYDAYKLIHDKRINFISLGERSYPPGSLVLILRRMSIPNSVFMLRVIQDLANYTDMLCRELPVKLRELKIDEVIADQMEAAGGLVAEVLQIPFVSVACALPINREPGIPLPVMPFRYSENKKALKIFRISTKTYDYIMYRHNKVIARHSHNFGLLKRYGLHECLSPLAQITQLVPTFDFPRKQLLKCYHAVGLLRSSYSTDLKLIMPWSAICI